jgi:dihydroorotate dehydrogenase
MLGSLLDLARPLLFALEPEQAHEMSLRALERGLYARADGADAPALGQTVMGLQFPNPLGIAAGFDKDARVPDAMLDAGFGFAEIGTVTPLQQAGNPRPRVFRLIADRAVVNRLGFNGGGHGAALARLEGRTVRGIVSVNIGANKDTLDKAADYVKGIETFNAVASFFTINISSPNTPGLRDLQAPAALDDLLGRIMAARERLVAAGGRRRPIVVKISPDIAEADLPAIAGRLLAHAVDGIAVSNTTLTRRGVRDVGLAAEAGGLSGRPLFHRATVMLARVHRETGGKIPLIGIGGIDSGAAALAKIEAGATLLQLYTGLIYEGLPLVDRIKRHLVEACAREGVTGIGALTGRRADDWAGQGLDA